MGGERTLEERMKEYKRKLFEEESVRYFLELYISDVERPKLFSVKSPPNFENDLNNIPEELASKLREMFGFKKGDKISFSIKKRNGENTWIVWKKENGDVKGFKGELVLKKRDENLDVYEEDSDFVKLIREKIIDVQIPDPEEKEWNDFIEETKKIRKILAISHTILDLLLFFSDFHMSFSGKSGKMDEQMDEHKRRVRNYANLLNLRRKINDEYIKKLKNFIEGKYYIGDISENIEKCKEHLKKKEIPNELKNLLGDRNISLSEENITITEIEGKDEWKITDDSIEIFVTEAQGKLRVYKRPKEHKEPKVIIVVPMLPNISIHCFSILSELKWLRELIIREEEGRKFLRDNVEIHILFMNRPYLKILNQEDKEKQKYFYDYKTESKNMVKSVINLNKLRIESFIKRYLERYIVREIEGAEEMEKDKKMKEIKKIARWLYKHVKTIDEKAVERDFWNEKKIEIPEDERKVIECDEETLNDINNKLKEAKNDYENDYYFSDVGVPEILEFPKPENKDIAEEATFKNILCYLRKIPENSLIIYSHTFRAIVLFNFYIDSIVKEGKSFFGWDSYIPMTKPFIVPLLHYLSTFSRSYNCSLLKMYNDIYKRYTICYLAHYLEFLFKDVIDILGLKIKGPKCNTCKSDTIIVKEDCDKCGRKHWVFECTSHWKEHALCGTISDYLWLPMEAYYTLESAFLDIPYTFMLTKRSYQLKNNQLKNKEEQNNETNFDEWKKYLESNINENIIKSLAKHFDKQKKYLESLLPK